MHVVLLGRPGAGKTTVAGRLQADFGIAKVSSGDIARKLAEQDEETRVALNNGLMAPEWVLRQEVKRELERAEITRGGWVLDGFPRTLEQLAALLAWIGPDAKYPIAYVNVYAPTMLCISRLLDRGRMPDDKPDNIARRLARHEEQSQPILAALVEADLMTFFPQASEEAYTGLIPYLRKNFAS